MKPFRAPLRVAIALICQCTISATGVAHAEAAAERQVGGAGASTFNGLPGVKPVDPLGERERVECEQIFVDRAEHGLMPERGPRYIATNLCSRNGGPVFNSPKLPPSIYRQLRGFNY